MEGPERELVLNAIGYSRRGYFLDMKFSPCIVNRHNPDSDKRKSSTAFVWGRTHATWSLDLLHNMGMLYHKVI